MWQQLLAVYTKWSSWVTTMAIAIVIFLAMTLLPHWRTFIALIKVGLGGSILLPFTGVITSNTTLGSLMTIIVLALLTGIYVSVLVQSIATLGLSRKNISGIGGFLLGFLGVGCAACGSIILTPLLTALGVGGVLTFLPLRGQEFAFIGIAVLLVSIYFLLMKMTKGGTCVMELQN